MLEISPAHLGDAMSWSTKNPADKNPDRFWSKVDIGKANECWEWTASKSNKGYGKLWWGPKLEGAHRIAYMLEHDVDQLPKRINGSRTEVMHSCDNPGCVNARHLSLGSAVLNQRDKVNKGRHHFHVRKTCSRGHAWTKENTGWIRGHKSKVDGTPWKVRYCRACHSARMKKAYPKEQKIRKTREYKDKKNARRRELYAQRHPNAKLRGPMPRKKDK